MRASICAAVAAGVLGGVLFSFRIDVGWGIVAGIGFAAAVFSFSSRKLRAGPKGPLLRLAVLFASLPVGALLALAFGSPWALLITMIVALLAVTAMRRRRAR